MTSSMESSHEPSRRESIATAVIGVGLFILTALHYFEVWGFRFPDFQP